MNLRPVDHQARRAAARAEPSPLTALREVVAGVFAADIAAATAAVCDGMREEAATQPDPLAGDLLLHAVVTLARGADALGREIEREVRLRFDAKLRPGEDLFSRTSRLSAAQLARVDEAELRLELAIDQCAADLEARIAADLAELTGVLAGLLGREAIRDTENPLHPRLLLRSLLAALGRLGFEPLTRLEIFRAYGAAMQRIAPDVCAQARLVLSELGLLRARLRMVGVRVPAAT